MIKYVSAGCTPCLVRISGLDLRNLLKGKQIFKTIGDSHPEMPGKILKIRLEPAFGAASMNVMIPPFVKIGTTLLARTEDNTSILTFNIDPDKWKEDE